jgi:hypothetical protein
VSTRACILSEAEVFNTASEAAPFRSYSCQQLELQRKTNRFYHQHNLGTTITEVEVVVHVSSVSYGSF